MERFVDEDRVFAYAYRCRNDSLLFPLYRRFVCEPLAKVLPRRVSPNVVTLVASLCSLLAFLFLVGAFGPVAALAERSSAVFLLPALGIFAYVALDNADGLHARRLGVSNPLGGFIDHWLDGFSCFMIPLGAAVAYPASPEWRVPLVVLAMWAFWALAWEENRTGVLHLAPLSDVEGTTVTLVAHLATAVFGLALWRTQVLGAALIDVVLGIAALAMASTAATTLWRNRTRRGDFLGVTASMGLVVAWWLEARAFGIATAHSLLVPVLIGLLGAKHVGDLQRNHLIGTVYRRFDRGFLIAGGALVLLTLAPPLRAEEAQRVLLGLVTLLAGAALTLQFAHTASHVSRKLGVGILRLRPGQGAAERSSA